MNCIRCGKKTLFDDDYCITCQDDIELEKIVDRMKRGEKDVRSNWWIVCPYCHHGTYHIDAKHKYDYVFEEGWQYIECPECGKTYIVNTEVTYTFSTERADNLAENQED